MFKKLLSSELVRNSSYYTIANVINAAVPFFILPILTRYLTPADYGIVSILQVVQSFLVILVGLNTHGAVSVNFFKMETRELRKFVGNVFLILLGSFFVLMVIGAFAYPLASSLLNIPGRWILVVAIAAFFQYLITLNLVLWQVEKRPIPYGITQISLTILNIGFSLIFIIAVSLDWRGRILGLALATILLGIAGFFSLKKRNYLRIRLDWHMIKDALKFGVPLIPHSLGGWINTAIDRIFLTSILGITVTGIYTVGYQFGMIIGLLAASFNKAWIPYLYERLKKNDYKLKISIVKITYLYFVGILLLATMIGTLGPYILRFFVGADFKDSGQYVIWIAFAYAANGMYFMVTNYIFYMKKTYILAWVTFSSAILNIALNYILIHKNGGIGAAQATMITYFFFFFLVWALSHKVYPMPWNIFKLKKNE